MNIKYCGYSNDERSIAEMKKGRLPIVIGGAGRLASCARAKLEANGITDISHTLVRINRRGEVATVQLLDEISYDYYFVLGFLELMQLPDSAFQGLHRCKGVYYLSEISNPEPISYEFYLQNKTKFQAVFDCLADEKSKRSMEEYLNAKINQDLRYL